MPTPATGYHLAFSQLSQEVSDRIRKLTWIKSQGPEIFKFIARVIGFAFSFWIFSIDTIFTKIAGMLTMCYFFFGIAITGVHEARHGTFVKSEKINKLFGYLFSDFWAGQSSEWWYDTHVLIHHPDTNIPTLNPPSFYFPWINRYIYFFIAPFFAIFWINISSGIYLWGKWRKLIAFTLCCVAGWIAQVALFSIALPWGYAIIATYILRSLFAPIFMHLAIFNHVGLETPEIRLPWLEHQLKTTRNIKKNWFLTGMGGSAFVECHTEHHLFPNINNHLLKKIRPIVEEYAKKINLPYFEETYFNVLKEAIRDYDQAFNLTSPIKSQSL